MDILNGRFENPDRLLHLLKEFHAMTQRRKVKKPPLRLGDSLRAIWGVYTNITITGQQIDKDNSRVISLPHRCLFFF